MTTPAERLAILSNQTYQDSIFTSSSGIYFSDANGIESDGVTDDYNALYTLINTTINGADAEIWFKDGACLIGTSITIPSNIKLKFMKGASIRPSSSKTITLTDNYIDCGIQNIFDISLGGSFAGTIKTREIYPQWFGAIGDGSNDDTTAIQSSIDFLKNSGEGGGVCFPNGIYKITSTLNIQSRSIKLFGVSRRTGDVFDNIATGTGGAVIVPTTDADPAILIDSQYETQGFAMEDIGIARNISIATSRTGTAIEFYLKNSSSGFRFDFYFNRVTIVNMDKCFYLNRQSSSTSWSQGKFTCENSFLLFNNQIHTYSNYATWNNFVFKNNYASSNGLGKYTTDFEYLSNPIIELSGVNVDISNNILESNAFCVSINNLYVHDVLTPFVKSGIVIEQNYFEANWGDYLIKIAGADGFYIGHQYIDDTATPSVGLTVPIDLQNSRNGICKVEAPRMVGCANVDFFTATDTETIIENGTTQTYYAVSEPYMETEHVNNYGISTTYSTCNERTILPFVGASACNSQTITGTNYKEFTLTIDMRANSGDWLVVTLPLYLEELINFPRFDLLINGDAVGVNDSIRVDYLTKTTLNKKWYLYVVAKKLTATCSSAKLRVYPYAGGIGSKTSYYIDPTVYTCSNIRYVRPFFNLDSIRFSSFPSAGTWKVGDKVINSVPSAGGFYGWICTTGGTSGTWKTFGAISS